MIKNDDIFLFEVELSDAEILSKWFNDKENIKYMSTIIRSKQHSKESVLDDIKELDNYYERLFMVCLNGCKKPIGHAGIDDIDFFDKRAEIFYLIGEKEHVGKGYGNKIVSLLLDYAFNKLNLNSIFASSTEINIQSISVLKNAGFKRIGIRREFNYIDEKYCDEIFFDITREDYEKIKLK